MKEKVPKPKKFGKFQNYAAFPETLLVVKKLSCSLGKMFTLHTNARLILIAAAHKQYPRADIREKNLQFFQIVIKISGLNIAYKKNMFN